MRRIISRPGRTWVLFPDYAPRQRTVSIHGHVDMKIDTQCDEESQDPQSDTHEEHREHSVSTCTSLVWKLDKLKISWTNWVAAERLGLCPRDVRQSLQTWYEPMVCHRSRGQRPSRSAANPICPTHFDLSNSHATLVPLKRF